VETQVQLAGFLLISFLKEHNSIIGIDFGYPEGMLLKKLNILKVLELAKGDKNMF